MKDTLDIKQVFLEIKALYIFAQYDDKNFIHEKYAWVIGGEVLTGLKSNTNMYFQDMGADEQSTICGIPIMGIDYYNVKKIKLYKEIKKWQETLKE